MNPADFAATFIVPAAGAVWVRRRRPATPDLPFLAYAGVRAEDALQGYASQAVPELHFAAIDVVKDDKLDTGGATFRVVHASRANDGFEMHAWLEAVFPAVPWDGPQAGTP